MLPFGLRSAPHIFNAIADALNWCLQRARIHFVLHYLDDYINVAPPRSDECQQGGDIATELCMCESRCTHGIPQAGHSHYVPCFLGSQIDTEAGILRLLEDKLLRLRALLQEWGTRKSCQYKQFESLIGLLNHTCKVIRPGRSFFCWLLDLLHATDSRPCGESIIWPNKVCQSDIAWWEEFVEQ